MDVSVVIPARNEEKAVVRTVLAAAGLPGVGEIIVVDDGSTDCTAPASRQAGARVLCHARPRGKGDALQTGARAALGKCLLFLDADLGDTAAGAVRLLEPLVRGDADVVVGAWPGRKGRGGFGLVVGLARWGLRFLTGRSLVSPLCGQRALTRGAFEHLQPLAGGWGAEMGMNIDAFLRGLAVVEVPVDMTHRSLGRSLAGFIHRGGQFCGVLLVIVRRCGPALRWKIAGPK
ncbi:MAG TPA: glycosyltransferase family 2 protein [Spirochaetia bacterium]|nr:glycosyltransferase family 2 protein [Spirochaetia bacterium]